MTRSRAGKGSLSAMTGMPIWRLRPSTSGVNAHLTGRGVHDAGGCCASSAARLSRRRAAPLAPDGGVSTWRRDQIEIPYGQYVFLLWSTLCFLIAPCPFGQIYAPYGPGLPDPIDDGFGSEGATPLLARSSRPRDDGPCPRGGPPVRPHCPTDANRRSNVWN